MVLHNDKRGDINSDNLVVRGKQSIVTAHVSTYIHTIYTDFNIPQAPGIVSL